MSFTNPAPIGGYVTGDFIDEDEINYWCAALPDCIDGAGGGSYTLTAPLSITGNTVTFDDVVINDDLTVTDDLTVSSVATITTLIATEIFPTTAQIGTLAVTGTAGVTGVLTATGGISLPGVLSTTGTGRILETGMSLPNTNSSVDIAAFRNITAHTSVTATRTYTLSCTGETNGDWFVFYNVSSFDQNLAGIVTDTVASGVGKKYLRVGGVWLQMTAF